jgi:arginine decarboxylase-like protein
LHIEKSVFTDSIMEHWRIPTTGLPQDFAIDKTGDLILRSTTWRGSREIKVRSIVERVKAPPYRSRAPLILRFNGILYSSMSRIHNGFRAAMEKHNYPGPFQDMFQYMYPIKVCYEAPVMARVLEYGKDFGIGLEAGSSGEFMLAVQKVAASGRETTILFDGYKERDDLRFAMDAENLGCRTTIVIGDLDQLRLTINIAKQSEWCPSIALRIRPQTAGAGRWAMSCGKDSKFGLPPRDIAEAQKLLAEASMLHTVVMIHFHPGSQVTRIAQIKRAVEEGVEIYIRFRRAGAEKLRSLNCGGGLVIEQGGSSNPKTTTDYDLQRYADTVVRTAAEVCRNADVEPPKIMIESGRALVDQHAMLVVEVLSVRPGEGNIDNSSESSCPDVRCQHTTHTVTDSGDVAICGFSMFRSLMDYFVEGKTFHFVPIQRLFEQPKHLVKVADISADSDGEIDRFPGGESRLPIHRQTEQAYYLAVPFVGAYQHALGCSHNLFGTVTEVDVPPMDGPWVESEIVVRPGSTVAEEIGRHGHVMTPDLFLQQRSSRNTYLELDYRAHKL